MFLVERTNASSVISTPLISTGSSIDYASRAAKILARKTALPVYVGCSVDSSGMTVEEEMEGFTTLVQAVMAQWEQVPD